MLKYTEDAEEPYRSRLDQARDLPTADELRGQSKDVLHALARPITLEELKVGYDLTRKASDSASE